MTPAGQPRSPAGAHHGIPSTVEQPSPQPGAPPEHDETMVQVIASKVLAEWLRNRQQLLVPFTIDLQKLDPVEVDVVMHATAAAAHAGGDPGEKGRERLDAAIARLNASEAQRAAFHQALHGPGMLREALASVRDVRMGAIVYAASLLALDRRRLVNRQYMRYLAARLDLSPQLARSLEQRFRPGV